MRVSLPGLLHHLVNAAHAPPVDGLYPNLRPHQFHLWHMFLCQLAALALWNTPGQTLPTSKSEWLQALRRLTPEFPHDEPWRLHGAWNKPAFLQPSADSSLAPENDQAKWKAIHAAPCLDIPTSTKNHEVPKNSLWHAPAEHWLYALACVQTGDNYQGVGHHRASRMNGVHRNFVSLALDPSGTGSWCPASAWLRDTQRILELRNNAPPPPGLPALLWTLPWPQGACLHIQDVDPLYIEVCRRIRLQPAPDTAQQDPERACIARHHPSPKTRFHPDDLRTTKGLVCDPWTPEVHARPPKALTIPPSGISIRLLASLMTGTYNEHQLVLPPLAKRAPAEQGSPAVLLVHAVLRDKAKTSGLLQLRLPIPAGVDLPLPPCGPHAILLHQALQDMRAARTATEYALARLVSRDARPEPRHFDVAKTHLVAHTFENSLHPRLFEQVLAHPNTGCAETSRQAIRKLLLSTATSAFDRLAPKAQAPAAITRLQIRHARQRLQHRLQTSFDFPPAPASPGAPHDTCLASAAMTAANIIHRLPPSTLAPIATGRASIHYPPLLRLRNAHPDALHQTSHAWPAFLRILALIASRQQPNRAALHAPGNPVGAWLCTGGSTIRPSPPPGPRPLLSLETLLHIVEAPAQTRHRTILHAFRSVCARTRHPAGLDVTELIGLLTTDPCPGSLTDAYHDRLATAYDSRQAAAPTRQVSGPAWLVPASIPSHPNTDEPPS